MWSLHVLHVLLWVSSGFSGSPPQSIRDTKLSVSMTDLSIQKPVSSARDAGDDQHHVTLQRTSGSVDGWMEYQFKFLPLLQRTGFDLQ